MTSPIGKFTKHTESTVDMHKLDPGTEQCELSDKTAQMGSECSDSERRLLDTMLISSVIDEKSNQVSDIMAENSVIQLPAPPQYDFKKSCQTGEGSCLRQSTLEQVPVGLSNDNSGNKCQPLSQNEQCELSEKTPLMGSQCSESERRVLDTVLISSAIDEKSNQDSDNMTENAVIQLPAPSQPDLEKSCQTGEGSCLQQSTLERVPVHLSNDKSENKCQPLSKNKQCESSEKTPQMDSEYSDSKQRVLGTVLISPVIDEKSNQVFDNMTENSVIQLPAPPQQDLEKSCQTGEGSCLQQSTLERVPVHLSNDKSENKHQPLSQNELVEISDTVTGFPVEDQTQSIPAQLNMSSVDPPSGDVAENNSSDSLERKSKSSTPTWLRHKGKRNSKSLKKYMLRSIGSSDRALRSRTREKPNSPESNSNLVDANNNDGVKRKSGRKKKKRREEGRTDEFSRIRTHLRYLLNRVSYEQSLIDAYSGEGWKGYSMEKLKPEKELQRAKSEILRRKLKIRDLFQNLDSLCAEGRLPESLFDSEGEIDSEDIFCAKCQSKELSMDNDIILCDGACDRGFHQLCLDPPLLTENIPAGDEGWLCPGCDCKDDCIDLVNDSLGTRLSLSDTWERVFPEAAAAAAAGNDVDHNLGLPSDDSDDDYNPNVPEDVDVEGGESSSDESEYASASENLEDLRHEDQYLGLPSEDSEDNDYNPNAPDLDNKVTEESSSSDFTSDSEDLAAVIKDNVSPGQDEDIISASLDDIKNFEGSSSQKCKVGKRPSIADELSSLLEPDPGQEGSTPVFGKRHVERLDYKKLYDETYQSDTSDDEDWTATATPGRKKKVTCKVTPTSPDGKAPNNSNHSIHTPRMNNHQNKVENTNDSPDGSRKSGSRDRKPGSSGPKRLGEAVVQRLYKSFKENQYPDRTTKESLAQELGLTFQQVDKWFGNTRWSFRHSSHMETGTGRNASQQATDSMDENKEALGGEERDRKLVFQEGSGEKSETRSTRKRKRMSETQASEARLDVDSAGTVSPASPSTADEMQTGHKMKTRKRK